MMEIKADRNMSLNKTSFFVKMHSFNPEENQNPTMVFEILDRDLAQMSVDKNKLKQWSMQVASEIEERYRELCIDNQEEDLKRAYRVGDFAPKIKVSSCEMLIKSLIGLKR